MSGVGSKFCGVRLKVVVLICLLLVASVFSSAETKNHNENEHVDSGSGSKYVWPEMKIGWKIVVGSIIGFLGAACGVIGGVGGGGIFVAMLNLIIGFDTKSSAAISKCMIMGATAVTNFYNLRGRHPALELPIIDYDLALLFQPMLLLGISIGVVLNVIFADWMITALLIVVFTVTSVGSFLKGVETWKKETISKKFLQEAAKLLESNGIGSQVEEFGCEPESLSDTTPDETKEPKRSKVSLVENIYWQDLGLLVVVWVILVGLQIAKNYTTTCSMLYWLLNLLQVPVTCGLSAYEAFSLYKRRRRIASNEEVGTNWRVYKLVLYCGCGVMAGVVGGLLGLGGGTVLGPLFLELGILPQVSSATTIFVMAFSSSMAVLEFYLLKRFPLSYAFYFFCVTIVAALVVQHVVKKWIDKLGRTSIIIFSMSSIIFVSALSLGSIGIVRMIERIRHKDYMGFDNLC